MNRGVNFVLVFFRGSRGKGSKKNILGRTFTDFSIPLPFFIDTEIYGIFPEQNLSNEIICSLEFNIYDSIGFTLSKKNYLFIFVYLTFLLFFSGFFLFSVLFLLIFFTSQENSVCYHLLRNFATNILRNSHEIYLKFTKFTKKSSFLFSFINCSRLYITHTH